MCCLMIISSQHVRRQLQLCLPGVRVFLDVDDLKDTGALESYIKHSAVVLIFLSKNYFCSLNWCGSYLFTAFTSHRTVLTWSGLRWPFNAQYHADERRLGAPLTRCVCSWHCSLREARAVAQEDKTSDTANLVSVKLLPKKGVLPNE